MRGFGILTDLPSANFIYASPMQSCGGNVITDRNEAWEITPEIRQGGESNAKDQTRLNKAENGHHLGQLCQLFLLSHAITLQAAESKFWLNILVTNNIRSM
jgi:hypothetical protein